MGWPRKDEDSRIYRDKDGSYLMVMVDELGPGGWDGIGNVMSHAEPPSLGSCCIRPGYISANFLKRIQWDELPEHWQRAFRPWLGEQTPESIRGFWRVGCQPRAGASR